jgi:uncharacterized membrane protein YccC
MKIVNKLLSKIGVDKLLHFLIGALATALASMTGESHMYATAIVVLCLSIGKEVLDEKFDIWDIIAGCVGCVVSIVMFYLT